MSFITGKYVHQIDSWCIGIPLDRSEMTWPRRLDQAGIPSTMLGKMDFCGEYQDGGFTHHRILHRRPVFQQIPLTTPYDSRLEGYRRWDKRLHLVQAGPRDEEVTCDVTSREALERTSPYEHDRVITGYALDYLRERGANRAKEGPWALYVGFIYPHWPFCVPHKYYDMYYPDKLALPFDARFPNESLHPALQFFQKSLDLGEVTEDMLRRTIAAYSGMVTCMDEMTGQILQELERQGFGDDTYIIYTTDHGESLGEHGLFYKENPYEGSVGVPLILSGPGIPEGNAVDAPVTLVDMYPTILDMAGLKAEPDRPGRSWLPLVRGEPHTRPAYAFAEFHGNMVKRAWYMIVQGDYKYIYYEKERPSLFNVKKDPRELEDLATDPGYVTVLKGFEKTLRSILDPEETAMRAKRDLGLTGPNGEDLTDTMTVDDLKQWEEG